MNSRTEKDMKARFAKRNLDELLSEMDDLAKTLHEKARRIEEFRHQLDQEFTDPDDPGRLESIDGNPVFTTNVMRRVMDSADNRNELQKVQMILMHTTALTQQH